jgi:hypothetical protein
MYRNMAAAFMTTTTPAAAQCIITIMTICIMAAAVINCGFYSLFYVAQTLLWPAALL